MIHKPPIPSSAAKPPTRPVKQFTPVKQAASDAGKKIVLYGASGLGKTTLAAAAPNPVFLDLDNGTTGLEVTVVPGISSFNDLRDAVKQSPAFIAPGGTLVIDTVTKIDEYLTEHLKDTLGLTSIKKLGYDRFPSSVETFRTLLSDLDAVARSGRNIILCAHAAIINYRNAMGEDYRQEGPKLTHSANDSCRDEMNAFADHVFRIAYEESTVEVQEAPGGMIQNARKIGRVVNATSRRVVHTTGTANMIAKSRVLAGGKHLPAAVSFENASDTSLWTMLFNPELIPN